jgi:predicted RND superfamily exporter protein
MLCLLLGLVIACARPRSIVDHPLVVLALLLAVSAGAVVALVRVDPLRFTIDVDPASEPLIGRNDPGIPVYRQATRDFGNDDLYVIVMETDDVFTTANLETLKRLTNRLRGLPGIAGVESLTRALSVRYDPATEQIEVTRLIEEIPDDARALEGLRERALGDPVYRKTLVSGDSRATAINITFQPMTDADFVARNLDGRIEALLAEEKGPGQRFFIAGRPHVRAQAYHLMISDIATLVPIAVAIAAMVLWLMGGSVAGVLLPLVSCSTATLWVFGAMATVGIDINLITLVLGSMMICIGSVYGVHVYARYEVIAAGVADRRSAALASLCYARVPVVMAGVTTCIGFGALLLTDIPATNELGAFSILGVASVTLISLTGVPAALARLPAAGPLRGASPGAPGSWASRGFGALLDHTLGVIARVAVGRPGAVLVVWSVFLVIAGFAIPRIAIDTDVITFFLKDSRVRTDFAAVNELLTGAVPIYVLVHGEEEGAFRDPPTLRAVERLQARLEGLEGVGQVLSSVDLIRLANEAMHQGDTAEARIPDTRTGLAEATFLLPKAKLRRFSTSNHSRGNLVVRTGQSGSAAVRALEDRIRGVLETADLPPGFSTGVTGNAVLLNRSADGIAGNQATQVGFAAVTIFLLICAVFRSFRVGLISMVPNVIPVVIFFGVLGAGAAALSLPTSLIGSIALGIAIDDTMHFLVAYQKRRGEGLSPDEAADQCIRQVGRPIVMTSIMLVVGFLVILASGFATLREFGALTALTMGICLTTDLLLLPALLVRLRA